MNSLSSIEDNVVGAVIFLSYILAALVFTSLVVSDIWKAYFIQYNALDEDVDFVSRLRYSSLQEP